LPFLTRELISTGITRAENVARVMANEDVLGQALARGVQRFSGLRAKVWA
jgi:ATP-dependent exoDNAse (exonuclease V) alpha subunit